VWPISIGAPWPYGSPSLGAGGRIFTGRCSWLETEILGVKGGYHIMRRCVSFRYRRLAKYQFAAADSLTQVLQIQLPTVAADDYNGGNIRSFRLQCANCHGRHSP
jgi:hypothetical protein